MMIQTTCQPDVCSRLRILDQLDGVLSALSRWWVMSCVKEDPYITFSSQAFTFPASSVLKIHFSLLLGLMDKKLIEDVRGYEELYYMTNKK